MRFLVDEDLPPAAAELLRALGHEAEHVRAIGLGGTPDRLVFAEAQKRKSVLLTADMGFGSLQRYPVGTHCGVVLLRFPDYFRRSEIVALVRRFVGSGDLSDLHGALVIVTPASVRIRRQ
jgi:predicted nuclease of predicted toxin-antitoxin system